MTSPRQQAKVVYSEQRKEGVPRIVALAEAQRVYEEAEAAKKLQMKVPTERREK